MTDQPVISRRQTLARLPTSAVWDQPGEGSPADINLTRQARQRHSQQVADLVQLRRVSGWYCGSVVAALNAHRAELARDRLDRLTADYLRKRASLAI